MAAASSLSGVAVLVTRAATQAAVTAATLRDRGAVPIEIPTIAIAPPQDDRELRAAVAALDRYDAIALTSENSVDALVAALAREAIDLRVLGATPIFAIGPATEAALARRGLRPALVPSEHRGEALARELQAALSSRGTFREGHSPRVFLPRAEAGREALPSLLREAGVVVDVITAYRTVWPRESAPLLARAFADDAVDAVTFTSGSTVEGLLALVPDAIAHLSRRAHTPDSRVVVASIGPVTTERCAALGVKVDVQARSATSNALVDALERHFAAQPQPSRRAGSGDRGSSRR